MGTWIKNIWTSPKSSMTAVIGMGVVTAIMAQQYPTIKWLGIAATILAAVSKLFMSDNHSSN